MCCVVVWLLVWVIGKVRGSCECVCDCLVWLSVVVGRKLVKVVMGKGKSKL